MDYTNRTDYLDKCLNKYIGTFIKKLNEEENIKIKILKEIINIFKLYPTVEEVHVLIHDDKLNIALMEFTYCDPSFLERTELFLKSKKTIYEYSHDYVLKRRDKDIIPKIDNDKISFDKIIEDFRERSKSIKIRNSDIFKVKEFSFKISESNGMLNTNLFDKSIYKFLGEKFIIKASMNKLENNITNDKKMLSPPVIKKI